MRKRSAKGKGASAPFFYSAIRFQYPALRLTLPKILNCVFCNPVHTTSLLLCRLSYLTKVRFDQVPAEYIRYYPKELNSKARSKEAKKQRSVLDNVKTRRLLIKLVWKGGLNRIPNSANNLWVRGCILWAETPAFSNSALANSHCWLNLSCLLLSNDLPPTQLSNHDWDSWR